jgi:uncharacterized protein (DUF427 family)
MVHVRDPYHRVDVLDSSRHVTVSLNGVPLAESTRARVIYETGLPPRWYLPADDVRMELLEPTESTSGCAYKGTASYFAVRGEGIDEDDLVWTYRDPRPDAERVRDLLCFFNERVDIEVDGEPQGRPETPWSRAR